MTVTGPRTAASTTTTTGLDTRTRRLLGASIVSVALFGTVSLTQVATRAGFDLTRHPLSMLSNGDLGWLQIANLIVTGLLTVLGAIGLRQALRGTPGGTWAPRLMAVNGIGLVLAGPFVLQGGDGFPVDGPAVEGITTGTIGHILAASIAFFALIGACYVLGRHYARTGHRAMAIASRSAGTFFLAADTYSMAGGTAGSLVLAIGVLTAMMWVAIVAHVERTRS